MTIVNRLATQLDRRDEEPNIELAQELVRENNIEGIHEIIHNLTNKNKKIQQDCIKVAYEIGNLKPKLISQYAPTFITLLKSPNNRLVWGSMQALAIIAKEVPEILMEQVHSIKLAIKNGSVITVDKGVLTLALLASINKENNEKIFPFLMDHLRTCRTKEIPQHSESIMIAVTDSNKEEFLNILQEREQYLTKPQHKRVAAIIKQFTT
ncbi:hypothetical protein SAMN05880501_106101 [Ureibacillus xyleni]|uniref:HEAT repeat protein n=1 Tax=Ureibacillus xyleni TaxID=614648 RepID=A0A285STV1_9BACL|nr:hypothetical protein [Ureibacillus xyleni]SOC11200.1 hypothetical protein SAMN05880501_106101 [Ureibacillus xyleni]